MNWPLTVLWIFAQDRFHLGKEIVGRVSAQAFDARLVEHSVSRSSSAVAPRGA